MAYTSKREFLIEKVLLIDPMQIHSRGENITIFFCDRRSNETVQFSRLKFYQTEGPQL